MTDDRLRDGTTAALDLIKTGPDAVYCTRCHATPGQPCTGVTTGRHHQERLWETRNTVLATLHAALGLDPYTGQPA